MGLQEILWTLQSLPGSWQNILDILLVASVFFVILQVVRGTRAANLLRGIAIVLIVVWGLSALLNLQAFTWLLSRTLTATAVALPVLFQDELRRWFDRVGRFGLLRERRQEGLTDTSLITNICDAVRLLANQKFGVLIALEREIGLQDYVDTGTRLDALTTSALLQTIFFPKTFLHDGAVIIRADRIMAAACTLPVSSSRFLPDRSMGLRHRAALGLSEVSDAVVVVVSEETGRISVVVDGRFRHRGIDVERLAAILADNLRAPGPPGVVQAIEGLRRVSERIRKPEES
jgi:diadenylate cyclase